MPTKLFLAGSLAFVAICNPLGPAEACFNNDGGTRVLLNEPPKNIEHVTDIAHIKIERYYNHVYSEAKVISTLKGFDGVSEFIIIGNRGGGSCDNGPDANNVGYPFYIAGKIIHRLGKRPVFWGIWRGEEQQINYPPSAQSYADAPP
ncbi:hypothetical protein [Methylobacterium sp. Leaf399]|uniref:hypothetical protein n=1 Tax=Methylobacterium sp. Leaf399 TaxID=1736364 RepID=UPI0012E3BD8C|nr:hypothetical protein [Methylobacterium sp. Leaf399]